MISIIFKQEEKKSVALDDNIEIGECTFEESENTWNIVHTGVGVNYQGQGIARKLVDCVIENAKKNNKSVIASCFYAKRVLEKYENN